MSDLTLFQSKKVRGENGPGCWAMRPVEGHPDRCLFQWLLDTDIKVWYFLPFSRILTLDFISGLDTSVHHRQGPVRHPVRIHRQHTRARSCFARWPDARLHSCLLQWYGRRGPTYALRPDYSSESRLTKILDFSVTASKTPAMCASQQRPLPVNQSPNNYELQLSQENQTKRILLILPDVNQELKTLLSAACKW